VGPAAAVHWLPTDPATSAHALSILFGATLRVTLLLALVAAALWLWRRRTAATLRAALLAGALLVLPLLPAARALPLFWKAPVLDGMAATVLLTLGSAEVRGAAWHARGAGEPGPIGLADAVAIHWPTLLLAVWAAGALAMLLVVLRGLLFVRRLARSAMPVRDRQWLELLDECAAAVGVRRRVRLLRHAGVATPLTWGLVRPAVLLPTTTGAWPVEHRRAVLLHELAHVRRGDCPIQLLALLACALFWFHPAVWWCARRLWFERERACDDRVLEAGTRPSVYAECLLRVADGARRGPALGVGADAAAVSVGIARPPRLLERLDAVLDERAVRQTPSRARCALLLGLGACVLLPVALSRLSPRRDVLLGALHDDGWATRQYAAKILAVLEDRRIGHGPLPKPADVQCRQVRLPAASAPPIAPLAHPGPAPEATRPATCPHGTP
jgi:beta-lactamase regulating signal transducer with metallopeptidase domain